MIYEKGYFWIVFIIVSIAIFFIKYDNNKKSVFKIFQNNLHFIISATGAVVVSIFYNIDYQIFCNPINWTKWFLICSWCSFGLVLILKKVHFARSFIFGLISFIAIYTILFGGFEYLGFILINSIIIIPFYLIALYFNKKTKSRKFDFLNFYGIVILLPYLILYFIFSQIKNTNKTFKLLLITPSILILIFSGFTAYRLTKINSKIIETNYNYVSVEKLKHNFTDKYLLERTLGVHWKYHTKICLYDGWRPPFHDPILIMSRNISSIFTANYEISPEFKKGKEMYKYVFPENLTEFNCKCGKHERWPKDL